MNIGFVALGNEECETCTKQAVHAKYPTPDHVAQTCDACVAQQQHLLRATSARNEYRDDALVKEDGHVIVSADLQKLIMLSRLLGIKSCLFTPRLIVFNETFAPLGPKPTKAELSATAILWDEATTGRNAEDITNAFWKISTQHGTAKSFTIWLDNCCGHNKNWMLYAMFVTMLNSGYFEPDTITLKYFEAGHTFLSADSVHHGVELELKKKNVEEFVDFVDAVGAALKGSVKTTVLSFSDLRGRCDGSSKHRPSKMEPRPYLACFSVVQFRKGKECLYYRTSISADEYTQLWFLRKDFPVASLPSTRSRARGVPEDRKQPIVHNLGPFMRPNARLFWDDIPTCQE